MEMDNRAFHFDDHYEPDGNGASKCNQPDNLGLSKTRKNNDGGFLYSVDEVPPWHQCLLLGLQQFLTMAISTITTPYIIGPVLCIPVNSAATANILATIFFTSALTTLLQTTIGVRLPIIQGSSASFYAPLFAIMNLPEWRCPAENNSTTFNATHAENKESADEVWNVRMREIQGAIALASIVPVVLSATGAITVLMRFITPLVVTPTVTLIGLSLVENACNMASMNWPISIITISLLILFNQFFQNVPLPYPSHQRGCCFQIKWFYWFRYFPIVTVIIIMWASCHILTIYNVLDTKDAARTDIKIELLQHVGWFRMPYPGQWGWPLTFSVASVLGMLSAVVATIIESIGDYYSCARLSGAPPPPAHAVSRGILMEGIGCICAALWGTGTGTTSYSDNIGAITITKVSSRRVFQCATMFMFFVAIVTKIGATLITIPEPIIGGLMMFIFSMITAVGISNIQFIDLNSSRNLFILGFPLFVGLSLPKWIATHPGVIQTGNSSIDQVFTVLLSTSMLVGGVLGFILDNTIPGTQDERGIIKFNKQIGAGASTGSSVYDFPIGMDSIRKIACFKILPFCPTFVTPRWLQRTHERNNENSQTYVSQHVTENSNL